jgi:tRNA(Ile2) C34 agmatinyltransferase TiaS
MMRRRNWARIVYAIWAWFAIVDMISTVNEQVAIYGTVALSSQVALYLLSVGPLFVGESAKWFRAGMKKCPFCGREIRSEAVKCRYCRSWLNSDSTPPGGIRQT